VKALKSEVVEALAKAIESVGKDSTLLALFYTCLALEKIRELDEGADKVLIEVIDDTLKRRRGQ
jgi:hypothetical protein